MDIEFDPAKDAANLAKHGILLADFEGFDGEFSAVVDDRFEYGETRYQARGYCVVYAETSTGIRLISFRRAREKEMRRHE